MGQTALLPFRRKACWGIFRPEKSDGFSRVWTREQHATSRPPKPLSSDVKFLCFITLSTSFFHFRSTSSSSFRWPGHSLRPSTILYAYYMSIPLQHAFQSLQKCLCHPHIFSNYFICLLCRSRRVNYGVSLTGTVSGWRLNSSSTLWNWTSDLKGVWNSPACLRSQDPWVQSRASMLTGGQVRWQVLFPEHARHTASNHWSPTVMYIHLAPHRQHRPFPLARCSRAVAAACENRERT